MVRSARTEQDETVERMLRFLLRRVVLGVVVLWAASTVTFAFFASVYLPLKTQPLLPAYWHWLSGIPSGRSLSHGLSGRLWPIVAPALAHTLALVVFAFAVVLVFALIFGCTAALYRGSLVDTTLRASGHLTWAVPPFIVGLVLLQLLANNSGGAGLHVFPPGGWAGECPGGLGIDLHTFRCPSAGHGIGYLGHVLWYLTLPAFALALGYLGLHTRYLRAAVVRSLGTQYATTARSKGLPERSVVAKHALRNSLIVFAPALLTDFGSIFGASLAIDLVFSLNGIGSLFVSVLNTNATAPVIDTYAAQLLLLIGGAFVIIASIAAELVVGLLDPRIGFDE